PDDEMGYKLEFDFGQDSGDEDGEAPDFTGQEPVGKCPKCGGNVFEHGMRYVCENAVASPKTCDFTSGKVILQQEITREQIHKLLTEGKTDLLTSFKSSRTGRTFKAYLAKQKDGTIGFEFEAKAPKKTAAKAGDAEADGKAAPARKTATKTAAAKAPAKKTAARKTTAKAKPVKKEATSGASNNAAVEDEDPPF
ncbi:MAG: topoisomerase C-terminal repeat-containing protein, partial [Pandoraea sp.]|nr:topoisomerase C-terminal repeat-containing protein [Pandoraea sp.]